MIYFVITSAIIVIYVFATYNKFVTLKTRIQASIQEIGNQLKRQASLIPSLVDSAKGYLKHEKEIFSKLTEARKTILDASETNDPQKMINANDKLQKTFGQFKALMESTPEIRGVEAVTRLMDDLRDTADKIMYARRTLIDLTADYNISVVTLPSSIIASIFMFGKEKGLSTPIEGEHIEVSSEETKTPKVDL